MGNEMGNNNTTSLNEEENLRVEEEPKEIASSVDDVKQENQVVAELEANDFLESVEHFSVDNHTPTKEEEDVDFPLDESPKVEASVKEESSDMIDNQRHDSFSNETEDGSLVELSMNEIIPNQDESLDYPIGKDDQEPEEPDQSENDQHCESTTIETSSTCASTENDPLPENEDLDDVEARVETEIIDVSEREIGDWSVEQNEEVEEEKDLSEDASENVMTQPNEQSGSVSKAITVTNSSETEEKFISNELSEELVNESLKDEVSEFESNKDFPSEESVVSEDDHQGNDENDRSEPKIIDRSDETTLDSKCLVAKILVSMNELAFDTASHDYITKQCDDEAIPSETTKVSSRESVERSSTDSDHDSVQYAQMRKSPSFSVDLQNEESEQTPLLLYEDKAELQSSPRSESDAISLGSASTILNGQAMVVEEKGVAMERSDSEKSSKTTFLGFLKEEEESHIVVTTPTRQENESLDIGREVKNVNKGVGQSIKVTVLQLLLHCPKVKRRERQDHHSLEIACVVPQ